MNVAEKALPRIALFLSQPDTLREVDQILREEYSSFMLITEREKFKEFTLPLFVVVDQAADVAAIRELRPAEGTRILLILDEEDNEMMSAAFEAGADECLARPFPRETLIEKTEKFLAQFRD